MTDFKIGPVKNEVYKVEAFGNSFKLIDSKGTKVGTMGIGTGTRKGAYEAGEALQAYVQKNGKKVYRKVSMDVYNNLVAPMATEGGGVQFEFSMARARRRDVHAIKFSECNHGRCKSTRADDFSRARSSQR